MKRFNLSCFALIIAGCSMLLLFSGSQITGGQGKIISSGDSHYLANTVIVKFKNLPPIDTENKVFLGNDFLSKISSFNISEAEILFPSSQRKAGHPLANIVELRYKSESDPFFVAAKLSQLDEIEWAEPRFLYLPAFVPNDPNYNLQWNLQKIKAEEAWNITSGDTSVVIAIIDTGVDWDHPDIWDNLWINHGEIPNNGIDDDGNGYIDDYIGWDFGGSDGTPNNDPREDRPDHGTHVAGIASAVTNNNTGIASIGYKSKIMAVKTSRDDMRNPQNNAPYIVYGYEGIVYAADNGADVINCSWGGGNFSRLAQETINYASSQGSLIVAASGNSNVSTKFYPAAYNNVLAVSSTDQGDLKSSFSNYGNYIDVSAPGSTIYSTWQKDTYKYASGTSMAAPLVAGLAGLVKAQFPHYTPEQVGQQVRVTADNIDAINPSYEKMLGSGRINAFKAVSTENALAVRAIDIKFGDAPPGGNGNGAFEPGEQCTIELTYVNYLSTTSNLSIYTSTNSQFVTVNSSAYNAGIVAAYDTFSNQSNKIVFTIAPNVPANSIVDFIITYVDGDNLDFQWISTTVNPSYATQAGNKIALTITSKGTLGFNDYYTNLQGDGFRYDEGSNLLFEGSFMYGTSVSKLVDGARGNTGTSQNNEFEVVQPFIISVPGYVADQQGSSLFNDNLAGTNKIGINTHLSSYSFVEDGHQKYIILRYRMLNATNQNLSNLYAGLFFDWDLIEATGNDDFTAWDAEGNLAYIHNVGSTISTYVGSALISSNDYGYWGILNPGGDGGFSIYDGFSKAEKWQSISSGVGKQQAGAGDVSYVISGGPFSIPSGEAIHVAFAVAAGEDMNSLRESIQAARIKYNEVIVTSIENTEENIPTDFVLYQNYPNPFNPSTKIKFAIPQSDTQIQGENGSSLTTLNIYDILGNKVSTILNENLKPGIYEVEWNAEGFSSGVYFYRLQVGEFSSVKKLILIR